MGPDLGKNCASGRAPAIGCPSAVGSLPRLNNESRLSNRLFKTQAHPSYAGYYQVFYLGPLASGLAALPTVTPLGSTLAALASAFPAVAIALGFAFILIGTTDTVTALVQGGWGFITIGVIVEFVLPISRRLR